MYASLRTEWLRRAGSVHSLGPRLEAFTPESARRFRSLCNHTRKSQHNFTWTGSLILKQLVVDVPLRQPPVGSGLFDRFLLAQPLFHVMGGMRLQ